MEKFYLQLYSLGMGNWTPTRENLTEIARMGYSGVEPCMSDYGGFSAEDFLELLNELGLSCPSSHMKVDEIAPNLEFMARIGVRYPTVSSHPFSTREEVLELAKLLNENGALAAEYGMKVAYHNHDREFNSFDELYALELLIRNTNPETVAFELDCGWCAAAGADPAELLCKYPGRFFGVHVREKGSVTGPGKMTKPGAPSPMQAMSPEEREAFLKKRAEQQKHGVRAGQGLVDWTKIKQIAAQTGIEYFVVERDSEYNGQSRLACLADDANFLRQL